MSYSMNWIIRAAQFAAEAHQGQTRKYTGRPYIEHPARVAARVMTLPYVDEDVVCAAWLHDVLEDCPGVDISIFMPRCYLLVQELTNPSKKFPELSRAERKEMDRQHLRNVSRWAKIIKLVDRIDNIRDMDNAPIDFRAQYYEESRLLHDALFVPADDIILELRQELQRLIYEAVWV